MASTADIAEELGTDGKTLRKFFRSDACEIEPVGQGSRYEIDEEEMDTLKEQFAAWSKGKARKANPATEDGDEDPKPAKKKKSKKSKVVEPEVLEDEDLELDDAAEEPTEEDLDAIEDLNLDDETEDVNDATELDEEPAPAPKKKKKSKKNKG